MKKIYFLVIAIFVFLTSVKADNYIIPKEAIRLRVVANSNSEEDQDIKYKVKEVLEIKMYNLLKDIKGVNEAKQIIGDNIENIKENINSYLLSNNYSNDFDVNFGSNYFPKKEYRGVIYEEGYYESLVVTLGSGEGNNWWCVLFPPLCLLEAKETEEKTKTEYKFFIQELFEKYF